MEPPPSPSEPAWPSEPEIPACPYQQEQTPYHPDPHKWDQT